MKKIQLSLLFVVCAIALGLQSCNNGKTYAEKKEEEADAIERFKSMLADSIGATFISESQFIAQDSTTKANEFVLFDESGVYMNIMTRGEGNVLKDGHYNILSKFVERIVSDEATLGKKSGDTLAINWGIYSKYTNPEEYKVTVSENSYSGAFQKNSIMYETYNAGTSNTAVPSGWLLPLRFLKVGRTTDSKKVARVRLIVPHSEGSSLAMQYVYPCYYEITYNLAK